MVAPSLIRRPKTTGVNTLMAPSVAEADEILAGFGYVEAELVS